MEPEAQQKVISLAQLMQSGNFVQKASEQQPHAVLRHRSPWFGKVALLAIL